jgi:hypothetical protein|tara:strand:- start:2221 stop:3576 length:1356 start_codon:yes stop_codon:yes gene_type:complete
MLWGDMKNRDYREIRTKDGKIIKLTQLPFCDEENYSYQYGFDDVSKKRQKLVYWINADPDGIIFSDDSAEFKYLDSHISGGFENYTGDYVLNVQAENLGKFLERGFLSRINQKVFNDIKLGRVKILFLNQCEGHQHDGILNDDCYNILTSEFKEFNIDERNVVFSDNNFILETEFKKHYPDSKINAIPHYWQLWRYVDCQAGVLTEEDLLKTKDTIRDKHFLSYNRSPHPHRCVAGLEMFRNKLYKKGIVSFPSDFDGIEDNQFSLQEGIDMFYNEEDYDKKLINKFRKDLPWMADVDTIFSSENIWDSVIIQTSFLKTYFSFVVGSVFDSYHDNEPYSVFMSEKIYKPITNFHPFLYLSNMGTLEILKELGFKTFHPFIDESYDREPDKLKRFNMVMSELNRLCEMELSELHELYWSMSDILIYNQRIYYNEVFSIAENRIEDVLKIVME